MLRAWILILLVATAVVALPATALAQSAGDDQYQDPLGASGGGGGSSNSGAKGAANGGGSGSAGDSASSAQADPSASGQGNQLPRTGLPAGVLALSGATMLGAGLLLRRRVAPRSEQ